MAKQNLTNKFFDINKFPPQPGLLIFPISMSAISTKQNAKKCFEYVNYITTARGGKVQKSPVGLNFIYGDYLYMHSDETASKLRNKFLQSMIDHKNSFINLISKNAWYVRHAFAFNTWNQVLLGSKEFMHYFGELKSVYKKDKKFQKYILEDLKAIGRQKLDDNQLNFFLEEILFFYLASKGKIKFDNAFVQGHEKWILLCYPGPPLKSEIYVFQKNPFKLKNPSNRFENSYYDLEAKKLYDYTRVDLETL